jgi:hypothetical protein
MNLHLRIPGIFRNEAKPPPIVGFEGREARHPVDQPTGTKRTSGSAIETRRPNAHCFVTDWQQDAAGSGTDLFADTKDTRSEDLACQWYWGLLWPPM